MDSNEVLNSALAVHESLSSWIPTLLSVLEERGVSRDEASLQMYRLFAKMEGITREFAPAISSLAVTYVLSKDVEAMRSALATALSEAVQRLGKGLVEVLKEEGYTKEQVSQEMSSLVGKIDALESSSLVKSLTLSVALDNYAKYLIKETMLPSQA